jgi:ABC-type amino acid transport system permease subunit
MRCCRDRGRPSTPDGDLSLQSGPDLCCPQGHTAFAYACAAAVIVLCLIFFIRKWAAKRQAASGRIFPVGKASLALFIGLPLLTWWLAGRTHRHECAGTDRL